MPASSLDAVLRAGLRLQAEAPERFEAEATGAKLCELRSAMKAKAKKAFGVSTKAFQFPSQIRFLKLKKYRGNIVYDLTKVQLTSPETVNDVTYDTKYQSQQANFYSKFGNMSMHITNGKPAMRVTKILVHRAEGENPTTTFQVCYLIADGAPADNSDPVISDSNEQKDLPGITFSKDSCKDEASLEEALRTAAKWVPNKWKPKMKRGTRENAMLEAATAELRQEVAYMIMQMAKAIRDAN